MGTEPARAACPAGQDGVKLPPVTHARVVSRVSEAIKWLEQELADLMEATAFSIEAEAKQKAPVDTGHLRSSIGAQRINQMMWFVRVQAHYALYVEMGTRYAGAQPYMGPAVETARRRLASAKVKTVRVIL